MSEKKTRLRVKIRRPEQIYTVVVECNYETTPLGYIKALAEKQINTWAAPTLDLIEVTPIESQE